MSEAVERMTKGERVELGQLIRKRERVMKAMVAERGAELLAEFEEQCNTIYRFDEDTVWKSAVEQAEKVIADAGEVIAHRCSELGIPPEFAPSLNMNWYGRGENAVAHRRAELRLVARTRIAAMQKEALRKIELLSLEAQTEIIANGLQSNVARGFLDRMTDITVLMPTLNVEEIKQKHIDKRLLMR